MRTRLGLVDGIFLLCLLVAERMRELSGVSLIRELISSYGLSVPQGQGVECFVPSPRSCWEAVESLGDGAHWEEVRSSGSCP